MERLIAGAYGTAGLWPTRLHMLPGLVLDLPQTPHDCLSPVEKCFHLVHFKMCFHTEARRYQSRWRAASSSRIFFSDIYKRRSLSGLKPDTVIQETTF